MLTAALAELGGPDYRAKQVWRWLASGVAGYDEMTDLPLSLRTQLADRVPLSSLTVVDEAHASDGTVKALLTPPTAAGRGRVDALPRRTPVAVPVVAVGLSADVHASARPARCGSGAT